MFSVKHLWQASGHVSGQVCVPAAEDGRTEQMKASRERRMGGEIERDTERERERERERKTEV